MGLYQQPNITCNWNPNHQRDYKNKILEEVMVEMVPNL